MAQAEVVANPHGATRGGEVQGGVSPHAPDRQELPQGSLEEVEGSSWAHLEGARRCQDQLVGLKVETILAGQGDIREVGGGW